MTDKALIPQTNRTMNALSKLCSDKKCLGFTSERDRETLNWMHIISLNFIYMRFNDASNQI